jgi:hypothetical protein
VPESTKRFPPLQETMFASQSERRETRNQKRETSSAGFSPYEADPGPPVRAKARATVVCYHGAMTGSHGETASLTDCRRAGHPPYKAAGLPAGEAARLSSPKSTRPTAEKSVTNIQDVQAHRGVRSSKPEGQYEQHSDSLSALSRRAANDRMALRYVRL